LDNDALFDENPRQFLIKLLIMSQDMSQDMSQEGEEKAQTKKFTLVIMKRFLMNNPGNEAWIKSQEKVHEATLVSQDRSKLL